jgi:hypothetical protein
LIAADEYGRLQGYSDSVAFDAASVDMSLGRIALPDGGFVFTALQSMTFGGVNSGPRVGPLVIDQIMYHAQEEENDYLRIVNMSASEVTLSGPGDRWRLDDAVSFKFPLGARLAPGQRAVVVGADPQEFRLRTGLPEEILVFGPYSGALSNRLDDVRLYHDFDDRSFLIDQVRYLDSVPWPTAADAGNVPITRRRLNDLGNNPANWTSQELPPGSHLGNGLFVLQFAAVLDEPLFGASYLGRGLRQAVAGDANGDGLFNSRDLVQVFQQGKYEVNEPADWLAGDWNLDGRFDTQDLVVAFQQGTYSSEARSVAVRDAALAGWPERRGSDVRLLSFQELEPWSITHN